jgi:hypothetical protein
MLESGDWTEHFGIYPYSKPTYENDHFLLMSSQTLPRFGVLTPSPGSSYDLQKLLIICRCQYKKNNGISSKLAPVSIVTLWVQVVMTNCGWGQWTAVEHGQSCTAGSDCVAAYSLTNSTNNTNWTHCTPSAMLHNSPLLPTAVSQNYLCP